MIHILLLSIWGCAVTGWACAYYVYKCATSNVAPALSVIFKLIFFSAVALAVATVYYSLINGTLVMYKFHGRIF